MIFKSLNKLLTGILLIGTVPTLGTPDLSVVGFLEPEGGIGKVPINIIEAIGNQLDVNFIATIPETINTSHDISQFSLVALKNPDHEPGRVALLTDLLWCVGRKPSDAIPQECKIKLAYSMLETSQIPKMWTKILNEEFDGVVVPDIAIEKMYKNSGVEIPIFVLPIPMVLSPYFEHPPHSDFPSEPFVFGDLSANKNPKVLIKAFAKAFKNSPKVHLILRAKKIDHKKLELLGKKYKVKNMSIEDGTLSLTQFIDHFSSFDCYINLSHGEGFSFIPREALALGIPAIITNNTASTTICNTGFVRAIPSTRKWTSNNYTPMFGEPCGHQFTCTVDDTVKALKDVYNNFSNYINKAKNGREWVKQYDVMNLKLQARYVTLIKPQNIIFGEENMITENTLITNSLQLYNKYKKLKENNQ